MLEETELLTHLDLRSSIAFGSADAQAAAAANARRARNGEACTQMLC